jgi:2-polyprenyl-6-methoxyphenol hydroxylase-like FAD-dependent oxidoreductase
MQAAPCCGWAPPSVNSAALADRVQVDFNDGLEEYDLVIGADGVYSQVRAHLFGSQYRPRFTGQGTWRYNVPGRRRSTTSFMCMGDGLPLGKCGFIPLSEQSGYVWLVQSEPGNPRHPGTAREYLSRAPGPVQESWESYASRLQ